MGKIRYPQTSTEWASTGYLVYLKTSLTADEPADILEYSKLHPEFPHQSTADQWFNESQFESYRRLGYDIGRKTFEHSVPKLSLSDASNLTPLAAFFADLFDTCSPPSRAVEQSFAKHGDALPAG